MDANDSGKTKRPTSSRETVKGRSASIDAASRRGAGQEARGRRAF